MVYRVWYPIFCASIRWLVDDERLVRYHRDDNGSDDQAHRAKCQFIYNQSITYRFPDICTFRLELFLPGNPRLSADVSGFLGLF